MIFPAFGLLASLAAVLYGIGHSNPALMILGLIGFGLALCASDHASDKANRKASESLSHAGHVRIGLAVYDRDDEAA
jgi:hypothetical protein